MPNIIPTLSSPALVQPNTDTTTIARRTVWGGAPLFNYETGEFLFDGTGNLVMGNGIQSLVQRIRKALATAQYRWKIYDTPSLGYFGSGLKGLIGRRYDDGVKINLAKKFIRDALITDSRIAALQVDATINQDQMFTLVFVQTRNGDTFELTQAWVIR
jgi:hypothetical protein